jgi:hypothetical protein
VRVENYTGIAVKVGVRWGNVGEDFVVANSSGQTIRVPGGYHRVYFKFHNDLQGVYEGDPLTLDDGQGKLITLSTNRDGNYAIRKK